MKDSLVELGIVLIHLQKFERAVGYLNRALSIREKELDEATDEGNKKEIIRIELQIAKIQNNIGCAFFEVGDTEEAKDSFECALEIQQRIIKNDKDSSAPGQLVMSSTICNLGKITSSFFLEILVPSSCLFNTNFLFFRSCSSRNF